jgi:hypothetical protein
MRALADAVQVQDNTALEYVQLSYESWNGPRDLSNVDFSSVTDQSIPTARTVQAVREQQADDSNSNSMRVNSVAVLVCCDDPHFSLDVSYGESKRGDGDPWRRFTILVSDTSKMTISMA